MYIKSKIKFLNNTSHILSTQYSMWLVATAFGEQLQYMSTTV